MTPQGNADPLISKEETQEQIVIKPALFDNIEDTSSSNSKGSIRILMDVPLNLTVELGRTVKTVKEVLSMGTGSLIELDKLAGEAVDVLINNHPIAKGEVVVIDENFGIRITEILDKADRLRQVK